MDRPSWLQENDYVWEEGFSERRVFKVRSIYNQGREMQLEICMAGRTGRVTRTLTQVQRNLMFVSVWKRHPTLKRLPD